ESISLSSRQIGNLVSNLAPAGRGRLCVPNPKRSSRANPARSCTSRSISFRALDCRGSRLRGQRSLRSDDAIMASRVRARTHLDRRRRPFSHCSTSFWHDNAMSPIGKPPNSPQTPVNKRAREKSLDQHTGSRHLGSCWHGSALLLNKAITYLHKDI